MVFEKSDSVVAIVWLGLLVPAASADDPFLWLEERHGDRASSGSTSRNELTKAELSRDPRLSDYWEKVLDLYSASDNIPYVYAQGGYLYNFWQDENNVSASGGARRRSRTRAPRRNGTRSSTSTNWRRRRGPTGCSPMPIASGLNTPLPGADVAGRRRRDDSARVRHQDQAFREGRLLSPVSKSSLTWFDQDTVIVTAAYTRMSRRFRAIRASSSGCAAGRSSQTPGPSTQPMSKTSRSRPIRRGTAATSSIAPSTSTNRELILNGLIKRKIPLHRRRVRHPLQGPDGFSLRSTWKAPDGPA